MHHVIIDASTTTNVTATPIPVAVSVLDDTPRNGQIPKNCANT